MSGDSLTAANASLADPGCHDEIKKVAVRLCSVRGKEKTGKHDFVSGEQDIR